MAASENEHLRRTAGPIRAHDQVQAFFRSLEGKENVEMVFSDHASRFEYWYETKVRLGGGVELSMTNFARSEAYIEISQDRKVVFGAVVVEFGVREMFFSFYEPEVLIGQSVFRPEKEQATKLEIKPDKGEDVLSKKGWEPTESLLAWLRTAVDNNKLDLPEVRLLPPEPELKGDP